MNQGLRQTIPYFAAVALGQGLAFLLLPIITRYLEEAAYGEYALATAVSGFVGMLASAWIRNVGMRLYFDALARRETRAFYVSTTLLQAALLVVVYAATLAALTAAGIELASLRVLISAGVTVLLGDQFAYATTLLRAEQRPGAYAAAEIAAGVIRFAATVAGLMLGARSAALLFDAASLGFLLAGGFAVAALWRRLQGHRLLDAAAAIEVLRVGPRSLPFSVSAWLERLADRLVLQFFAGTAVVGVYSVGYALGERIIGSLVQAVFMMAWPRILAAWNEGGPAAARHAIADAQRLYAWITVGPAVFLAVFGVPFTRWIAGPAYHDAATVVPTITVAIWLGGFGSYLNRHLELTKRFGVLSGVSLAGAGVNVILNVLLVPPFGMEGAALATLANYAFNATVFYVLRDRQISALHLAPFARAGGASAVAVAVGVGALGGGWPGMAAFVTVYLVFFVLALVRRGSAAAREDLG